MKNDTEVKKTISEAVSRVYENMTDLNTDVEIADRAVKFITEQLEAKDVLNLAVLREVQRQKRIRSIEEYHESGELFPDELPNRIMTYKGPDKVIYQLKARDAKLPQLDQHREKQLGNMERVMHSFSLWERRRKAVEPIMRENPDMTMGKAIKMVMTTVV